MAYHWVIVGLFALAYAWEARGDVEMIFNKFSYAGFLQCSVKVLLEQLPLDVFEKDGHGTTTDKFIYHEDFSFARVLCATKKQGEVFNEVMAAYQIYRKGEVLMEFGNLYKANFKDTYNLVFHNNDLLNQIYIDHARNEENIRKSIVVHNFTNQKRITIYFKKVLHYDIAYVGEFGCFKVSYLETPNKDKDKSKFFFPTLPKPVTAKECKLAFL